jgi:hypothetical protein
LWRSRARSPPRCLGSNVVPASSFLDVEQRH